MTKGVENGILSTLQREKKQDQILTCNQRANLLQLIISFSQIPVNNFQNAQHCAKALQCNNEPTAHYNYVLGLKVVALGKSAKRLDLEHSYHIKKNKVTL